MSSNYGAPLLAPLEDDDAAIRRKAKAARQVEYVGPSWEESYEANWWMVIPSVIGGPFTIAWLLLSFVFGPLLLHKGVELYPPPLSEPMVNILALAIGALLWWRWLRFTKNYNIYRLRDLGVWSVLVSYTLGAPAYLLVAATVGVIVAIIVGTILAIAAIVLVLAVLAGEGSTQTITVRPGETTRVRIKYE